ncbi:MAG: helix-turn-helix domain-containing protein [Pseudomonadota bacterium]
MHPKSDFGTHFRQLRKDQGISQQKFAERAQMSYRHVNFLENNRSMPSREMVLRIARTLELSLKHANLLLRSAGFTPSYKATPLDDDTMAFAKSALLRILDHQNPYPGIVMTPIGGLLMANDATLAILSQFVPADELQGINNIYEFILTDKRMKQSIVNWDQLAPKILAFVRQEVLEIDPNSESFQLLHRLESQTELQSQRDPNEMYSLDSPIFNLRFKLEDIEINFFSTYTTFGTPHDVALQELRIECFFPADDVTKKFCNDLQTSSTPK